MAEKDVSSHGAVERDVRFGEWGGGETRESRSRQYGTVGLFELSGKWGARHGFLVHIILEEALHAARFDGERRCLVAWSR